MITLGEFRAGERGRVEGYTQDDGYTQRLMQLGLIEGAEVRVLRCAPGGDPLEISVMGYALSLRRAEAELILMSREPA